jgi:anti-sigma factor RsiW
MQGNGMSRQPPIHVPDPALWRQSRALDLPEDEAAVFLDLAGFAEGRLDSDDSERVAERLAHDPYAAADVAAARALAMTGMSSETASEPVIARASALIGDAVPLPGSNSNIVPFRPRQWATTPLHGFARWGSLAAAVAVASWLGFTLGVDTSRSFAPAGQPGVESLVNDMLDAPSGFAHDLADGSQT